MPGAPPWRGDLAFTIDCRHARDTPSGDAHRVVIRDDWSVETPHDLAAERIASALGGYTSCVELVDRTIPLLRDKLALIARRDRPALRRGTGHYWRPTRRDSAKCCPSSGFGSLRTATEHLRGAAHLATLLDLPRWQVDTVVRNVARSCRPVLSLSAPASRLVREADGLEHLWRAGIHPDDLAELASHAAVVTDPLPVAYFEGVVYSGHRPEWMAPVLIHRPDADTAAWLAWQAPPAESDAGDWGLWLRYGLSRGEFAFALEHLVPAESVPAVVAATGWSDRTAAHVIIEFAKAECRPTPEQLSAVARRGMEDAIPGPAAVDAAVADAVKAEHPVDRSELGVMLTLTGNRPALTAALQLGARTVADLART